MSTISEGGYFNKSAYVALICLIAFVIVITICVIKQCIWDPLLAKPFETIRPVLSESVRRFSSFYRPQSPRTSSISIQKSYSDMYLTINNSPLLSNQNLITVTQSLPSNPINIKTPPRSYGSASWNDQHAYTNYGSDELDDEQVFTPILNFSCEYSPSTYNIKINIQNLQHMSLFAKAIKPNTNVFIRILLTTVPMKSYETSLQPYQDLIRFDETFLILNNIHPGDILNYQLKFLIILKIDNQYYEIAESVHSLKDDCLTYVLFVERTLDMNLKLVSSETK